MVKLTSMVKTSGCAAKLDPASLYKVISALPPLRDEHLLGGYEKADDALVYDIGDGKVAIETVDFFPPMVDDPYTFGQVAAANALSDVYAMGALPAVAMNLVCFPACLPLSVLEEILKGGSSKLKEASCALGGGHTISDPTPKYGLCVTGFAPKDKVWTNANAKVGDLLVLTKKIGVGALNTAAKAEMCSEEDFKACIESMTTLNMRARNIAIKYQVHSATDVTGFSLLGHSSEMAEASHVTIAIESEKVNFLSGALEAALYGLLPEGLYNNHAYLEDKVIFKNESIKREVKDLLYDPQTSGGLLLSMPKDDALAFLSEFKEPAFIVGYVKERGDASIEVY